MRVLFFGAEANRSTMALAMRSLHEFWCWVNAGAFHADLIVVQDRVLPDLRIGDVRLLVHNGIPALHGSQADVVSPKVFTVPSGSVMRRAPRPARPKRSKAVPMHCLCMKVGGLVRIVMGLSGTGLSL